MKFVIFILAALLSLASAQGFYIISTSETGFTATKNSAIIGVAGQPIQNVIDAIKNDAKGADCSIQFGNGETDTLSLVRDNYITFDGGANKTDWGKVVLLGNIKTVYSDNTPGIVYLINGVSLESKAIIIGYNTAIYNASVGNVTVSAGKLHSHTSGCAVFNGSTGTVTVNDGYLEGSTYAIHNGSTGSVFINGGIVDTFNDPTIYNSSSGTIIATGGTVSSRNSSGLAIYSIGKGKVKVSGNAVLTSVNSNTNRGTIYIAEDDSNAVASLEITGGTVKNTGNGNAVYNGSASTVIIRGGDISTLSTSIQAAVNNGAKGRIIIEGGTILSSYNAVRNTATGIININGGTFSSPGNIIGNDSTGTINVSNGSFSTDQVKDMSLVRNGGSGTINISGGTFESPNNSIYNGSIGTINISGGTIKSPGGSVYNFSTGTINISGGKIETAGTNNGTLHNYSTGIINISGGTILATAATGMAVNNRSAGKITVSGTAEIISENTSSTGATIYIANNTNTALRFEITGGKIQNNAENGNAIYNNSAGPMNINGGTISASYAINNGSTGTVYIGGSPNITGKIWVPGGRLRPFTRGDSVFVPSEKIYTLYLASYSSGTNAVTSGSNFRSNFDLHDSNYALAASSSSNNSNLIVRPAYIVGFDLNGGTGITPANVSVAQGQNFPDGRRPSTSSFTMAEYSNDGEWYTRIGSNYTKFTFGSTLVNANTTLYLKWVSKINIDTKSLGNGTYNEEYYAKVSASLGNSAEDVIAYSVVSGNLPGGLLLNSETGEISGTCQKAGTFKFTVRAKNNVDGGVSDKEFTIVVAKIAQAKPSILENSVIITENSVEFLEMGGVEFSKDSGASWQDNPIFGNLKDRTEYKFLLRKKETDNYLASESIERILKTLDPSINTDWYRANAFANQFEISTMAELKGLVALVNGDETFEGTINGVTFSGKMVALASDIELGEENWVPIGNRVRSFQGIFNGQGHTISGLYVKDVQYAGLFGNIGAGGQIKNVNVIATKIKTPTYSTKDIVSYYAGGLAGYYGSTLPIENCSVKADSIVVTAVGNINSVSSNVAYAYAGGLVGYSNAESISYSFAVANVAAIAQFSGQATVSYSGGLVGLTSVVNIKDSYAKGSASATAYRPYSGGLVGQVNNASITIDNSYASVDVSASGFGSTANLSFNSGAGGLVGYTSSVGSSTYEVTVKNSYATGNISNFSSAYGSGSTAVTCNSGGLIGWISNSATKIENSYSSGNISTSTTDNSNIYSGGLIGYIINEGSKKLAFAITNSYATGDVSSAVGGTSKSFYSYSGGLVGNMMNNPSYSDFLNDDDLLNATVENSYASGNISATGTNAYSGGVFGRYIENSSSASVYYYSAGASNAVGRICKSNGNCSNPEEERPGMFGKSGEELKKQATFVNWNFNNIWDIIEDTGMPFLRNTGYDLIYSLSPQTYVYNGGQIKPEPVVFPKNNSGAILTKNVHYTLSYGDNKNVGEGTITITGINSNNKGSSGTIAFNITPKELTVSGTQVTTKIYDGTTAAALTGANLNGVCGSDDVSLSNFTGTFASANAGTGISVASQMILIGDNISNYTLKQPVLTGTIEAKALATGDLQPIPTQLYNYSSGEVTPAVTVKDGSKTLVKDTDYTVSYANNTAIGEGASVTVTGKGNYKGELVTYFNIIPFGYFESFEGADTWTFVNGSQTNKWRIWNATSYNGSYSAYISNDNIENAYNTNATSIVHIYKDITFPISATNFTMTFYFKGNGESLGSTNYDYMTLRHGSTTSIPSAGSVWSSGTVLGTNYLNNANWSQKTITLSAATFSGQTRRFVFTWVNDNSSGTQPPAAIDDINIYVSSNPPSSSSSSVPSSSSTAPSSSSSMPSSSSSVPNPATLPFAETFEDYQNNWVLVNGTQTNKWMVGTSTMYAGDYSAYISNNGSANSYSLTSASTVHIYRDVTFPESSSNFTLEFYFKGMGEIYSGTEYDYMEVRYSNTTSTPVAGSLFTSGTSLGTYRGNSSWSLKTINLPAATFSGKTMRFVFTWRNDNSAGSPPPAAIDNISIAVSVPSSSSATPSSSSSVPSSSSTVPSSSSSIPSSSSSSVLTRIDNFANLDSLARTQEAWGAYTDIGDNGASTIGNANTGANGTYSDYIVVMQDGEDFVAKIKDYSLLQGANINNPYVALQLEAVNNGTDYDLSKCTGGLRYSYKGSGHYFIVGLSTVRDYAYHSVFRSASSAWTTSTVPFTSLSQPSWGTTVSFDAKKINSFMWEMRGGITGISTTGSLAVKDFYCIGDMTLPSSFVPSSSSSVPSSSSGEEILSSSSSEETTVSLLQIATSNNILQVRSGVNLQVVSDAVVEIYNLNGKSVAHYAFTAGVYNVSLGYLPKGLYIVKAKFGSERKTIKVPVN